MILGRILLNAFRFRKEFGAWHIWMNFHISIKAFQNFPRINYFEIILLHCYIKFNDKLVIVWTVKIPVRDGSNSN